MRSRLTRVTCAALLGGLAACHAATRSASSTSSPSGAPSSPALPSPSSAPSASSLSSGPAVALPAPSGGDASASPPGEGDRETGAPAVDTAFAPIELRFAQSPDGATGVQAEVARRFPAIGDDGRTIAVLDERSSIEEGSSLHLVLLDTRTNRDTAFMLWAESTQASRRPEAQRALSRSRWQSLVPGTTPPSDPSGVRFEAGEFRFVENDSPSAKVELRRVTRSGETRLSPVPHGLPGRLGPAAVPTRDVGASCGRWDALRAGWVSRDGKVYLFMLGASLGGRCGPPPAPVEYCSWVSR